MSLNAILLQTETVADTLANAAAAATTDVSVTENVSYLEFLMKGGIMIIPIIILLFYCIFVIVERYLSIKKATKQDVLLLHDVKAQLKAGKIDNALMVCNRQNTASGNILRSGIAIIGRPISEIESVMEKTANVEISQMEKGLGHLGLISGIAPILGFIGTISGVIKIFHTISNTGNLNIQTISGGLYEKMISSGAGLVVGVVAYAAYHLYNMWIDSFALKVEKQTLEIINIIHEPQHGN
ncbi:MotA/TolQ/ExbB proton channel family protein [Flavobacterium aurantiibacter]|uniref:Biopolymer transporter ExbB n=1 Tax=Flavobacterium aurantiibacter TaxID=2023067 RepID=A0A255ZL83_9FLAO|nr:MotA/TolQ/ExbB proton channel family protein [Flavobacterium aurantiibacter]OYQ42236.1 biopolymer transporter ExbB [Flavobacterium aurantiibacter]